MPHDHTYHCESASIMIATLNVCGLKKKLEIGILENYIKNFDIICLSETKVAKADEVNVPGFKYIAALNKNRNHKFCGIHGVGVLIKVHLAKHITIITDLNADTALWLLVDEDLLGYKFIIGSIYMPYEGSKYYEKDQFEVLSSDIINLNSLYDVPLYLTGDFNARTSTLVI